MDMAELNRIAQHGLGGEFRLNEPMRKHTSWRAGGPADRAYFPRDLKDLARFVRTIPKDEPVYVVGLGSNLLVRDGGLRGTVVFTHGALNEIRIEPGGEGAQLVYAEAGVASPKVARFAATHGLRGAEFLAGIPGTVGGALAMNAGCYGSETWEIVESVLCLQARRRAGAACSRGVRDRLSACRAAQRSAEQRSKQACRTRAPCAERLAPGVQAGRVVRRRVVRARARRWRRIPRASSRICCSGASPRSRWTSPTPDRCSATRPATMPRA